MPVSPSSLVWSWTIELSADGVTWADIKRDVVKTQSISFKRGLSGTAATDCVADVGVLDFVLDNSKANSAGLLGYYSPGHANCRAIFAFNSYVRLKFTSTLTGPTTITRYKFFGRIRAIDPDSGKFGSRETHVQVVDYMQYFLDNQTERLTIQENKRFDELMTAILPTPAPLDTDFDVDSSTTELAFHLEKDEQTTLMQVAQKICQSTLGKLYVIGSATSGEVLRYENRYARAMTDISATLDNSMSSIKVGWQYGDKYNKVKASITPYFVDTTVQTLGSLESEIPIRPGKTETIELRLRDPGGRERISGFDFVDPLVAGTDYNVSSASGTTNGNMNSSVTVSTTNGSNTVLRSVTNNSGITVYVNMMIVRGRGIYPYDMIDFNYGSGNNILNYSMPYLNNANLGKSIGEVIYSRVSRDIPNISNVMFYAEATEESMENFLVCDIGSRVRIIEEVTGVDMEGFINWYEIVIEDGVMVQVSWMFVPADAEDNYFIWDDATRGVWDSPDYVYGI